MRNRIKEALEVLETEEERGKGSLAMRTTGHREGLVKGM